MKTINVFILAAGIGERLRPITDYIPKPLLPVLGKPVLQTVLERISNIPVNKIGINLHHHKESIENLVTQSAFTDRIKLFPEEQILGTGGALKNAEALLREGIFLVHNADILSDIVMEKIIEEHLSSENLATLAVHDYPEFNNLLIDEKGFIVGVHPHAYPPPSRGRDSENNTPSPGGSAPDFIPQSPGGRRLAGEGRGQGGVGKNKLLAFTGIAVYQPDFLGFIPSGASGVVNAWLKAISKGNKIGTFDATGCYWSDIGTPLSYARTVINKLRGEGETIYIHQSVDTCEHAEFDGYVVIEQGNVLNKGTFLRNCIVLPGSLITPPNPPLTKGGTKGGEALTKGGTKGGEALTKGGIGGVKPLSALSGEGKVEFFENCIIGPGFRVDLDEAELLGPSEISGALLIGTGGSDRRYSRIKNNGKSHVLMQCTVQDPDFQRHIEYSKFFREHDVPIPDLIDSDFEKMTALFEDLGDLSLYSWLKCKRGMEQVERMYKQVLDMLLSIHSVTYRHIAECPMLYKRLFDYEHLRWETSYFVENFVEGLMKMRIDNLSTLHDEFHRLAFLVESFPKTIVHRDFQSQNIMITKGTIPRLLDYQGARMGPPAYDVASILWDPYYRLDDTLREKLIDYYISQIEVDPPSPLFRDTLLPCRLQRHMQALGAYGFLSLKKDKRYFLKHVHEGLRLLNEDAELARGTYPVLYNLVMKLSYPSLQIL